MERYFYSHDPETICPRVGLGEYDGDALVTPLVQSTTFCRNGVDSASTHAYSRVSNPTVAALEEALGTLEAAPPAVCFSSGLAAETALFTAVLRAGDHVVCGRAVYGGTTRLLQEVFSGLGIETTFVDATRIAALGDAVCERTRLVFVETPANPTLELTDLSAAAAVAHEAAALLAVDNTFMTPVLQQPLECGADLSVYSTTKFIEGHSVALGGAVVGRDGELLERIRFIRKSTGGIQTPFHAWLTLNGIKTLPLRIRRQSQSAGTITEWLDLHPRISRVCYPALAEGLQRRIAAEQHRGCHGPVVSFELKGGADAASEFVRRLKLCRLVEHVGSVDTLITHPATMTHADVAAGQRAAVGITDGLLRLSVGLEPAEAIIADLEQSLSERTIFAATPARKEVQPCPELL